MQLQIIVKFQNSTKNDRPENNPVEQLVSGKFELPEIEDNTVENPIVSTGYSVRLHSGNLDENKTSLGMEIMSDVTTLLAENQKEMLKLIASTHEENT